jgi:hypothetical protein
MMSASTHVLFHEEQRFRQWWMVLLVAVVLASTVGVFAWAFYQQLLVGEPLTTPCRTLLL